MEVVTAAVFAALGARHRSFPLVAALCWLAAIGVVLAFVDAAVLRLPDQLTIAAAVGLCAGLGLTAAVEQRSIALVRALQAGLVLFVGYLALAAIGRSSLGFGDVKLAGVLGMALGWFGWNTVAEATLLTVVLAGSYGALLLLGGRVTPRDSLPLGPFLLVGALAAVLLPS